MRILVVDDERLARSRLLRLLERIPDARVIGEAENGAAALELIRTLKPDVVLLDVDMPGLDGITLAEQGGLPPIVFTTAHPQFAADAFDVDAVDYLVKPVRQDRLERALEKALRRNGAVPRREQIAVHGPGSVRFIDVGHIVALRALEKYVEFTVDGEQLLTRESLDTLEGRLADLGFVRVHRSALVRREAIVELLSENGSAVAKLSDGTSTPVSRRHAAHLRRVLGLRSSS